MKVGHTAAMELFVATMYRKRVNDFEFDLYLYNVAERRCRNQNRPVNNDTATEDRV